jgi:carboxypeptidase Q
MRHVLVCLATLPLFFAICAAEQRQDPRGPSTPEERARFVSIARKFEANPLDPSLAKDREWAILWLIQVPDIQTKLCAEVLGSAYKKEKYRHSSEIAAQLLLSGGVFVIENPDKAKDDKAQYLAAVEGVLKAYQSILREEPKATSTALNDLLQKQSQGSLTDFVHDSSKKCK